MFENLVNYDISQAHLPAGLSACQFENLVNYDISQAIGGQCSPKRWFENLVNYDISQAKKNGKSERQWFENLVNHNVYYVLASKHGGIAIMKDETIARIRQFTEDRDWDQFHSPANLAKSIVIEAAELLECFQWSDTDFDIEHIKEELADVLFYSQNMLDKLGLDADEIVNAKMEKNEAKYPVEKAKGSSAKYTEL